MMRLTILAAALALLGTGPAMAATPAQLTAGKAYVDQLYRQVVRDDFDYRSARYAPELKNWIKRDDACEKKGGGVCAIDAEPFCDCQDNSGMKVVGSRIMAKSATTASVILNVKWTDAVKRYTIDLVLIGGTWYVSDLHTPNMPSFLAFLRREVPKAERAG